MAGKKHAVELKTHHAIKRLFPKVVIEHVKKVMKQKSAKKK
jgi:hypothetical protein